MYRPQIKVLDCTIRDGGLINDHHFSDEFVREAYRALSKSGVDYMEMGYRSSKELCPTKEFGAWKYCDDDKIREIIDGIESNMKISIMVDAHRVREQTFAPADQSPVDMIRVATYVKDIDKAIDLAKRTKDLGYETCVNIMAISKESEFALIEALDQLAKTNIDCVYVVDSYGALYCEQIEYLVKLYQEHVPGKEIGIHAHNNQQLAFSNTVEGIIHNAQLPRRLALRHRPRPGQLLPGAAHRFPEEPQIQSQPDPEIHPGLHAPPARADRMGLHHPLHADGDSRTSTRVRPSPVGNRRTRTNTPSSTSDCSKA